MISFQTDGHRFNYRVAAIIEKEGSVLLHRVQGDDFWVLPGGRVEAGESSADALVREFDEELGASIQVQELAVVIENFFEYAGEAGHEIGFYFQARLSPDDSRMLRPGPYAGREEQVPLIFDWFPRSELKSINIKPAVLTEFLINAPIGIRHIVCRD